MLIIQDRIVNFSANFSENSVESIFNSIETLSKFLIAGISDKNTGIIKEEEILSMANHIKEISSPGATLFNLKEHARMNLEARGETCEL